MNSTSELLQERGTTHGSFSENAHYGQALRDLFRSSPQWHRMPPEHRESLDVIAVKLSRILSGQSMHPDHFADIAGYAELAAKACTR